MTKYIITDLYDGDIRVFKNKDEVITYLQERIGDLTIERVK